MSVRNVTYVRTYVVRNGGRGQLSSEWRHNENDVTVIIAGRRYGDWRHAATGCSALVCRPIYVGLLIGLVNILSRCLSNCCNICINVILFTGHWFDALISSVTDQNVFALLICFNLCTFGCLMFVRARKYGSMTSLSCEFWSFTSMLLCNKVHVGFADWSADWLILLACFIVLQLRSDSC